AGPSGLATRRTSTSTYSAERSCSRAASDSFADFATTAPAPASSAERIASAVAVASPDPAITGFFNSMPAKTTERSRNGDRLVKERDVGGHDRIPEARVVAESSGHHPGALRGGENLTNTFVGTLAVESRVDGDIRHTDECDVGSCGEDVVERVV